MDRKALDSVPGRERAEQDPTLKGQLLDAVSDAIIAITPNGGLAYANEAASRQLGCSPESAESLGPWGWVSATGRAEIASRLRRVLEDGELRFETQSLSRDGVVLHAEVHARVIPTNEGPLVVAVCRDVSARVAAEEVIRHLAFHDELTGLANRTSLEEQLRSAIVTADRHDDLVGVVYIDLDDFKPVNDTFGHAMGDRVLKSVACRLRSCVRECDTVARLGGDEFMVLFPRLRWRADLAAAARKLSDVLSAPIEIDEHEVRVSASVGLAMYERGEAPDELATRADHAMYRAKQNGLPGWEAFLSEE